MMPPKKKAGSAPAAGPKPLSKGHGTKPQGELSGRSTRKDIPQRLPVECSVGAGKYDANPNAQRFESFAAFADFVLDETSRSVARGGRYVCGPLDPSKPNDKGSVRNMGAVLPRTWIAADIDGCPPTEYEALMRCANRWRGFAYATSSDKPESRRLRLIWEVAALLDRASGVAQGAWIAAELKACAPNAKVDQCTFRGEQPIFLPLRGAWSDRWDEQPAMPRMSMPIISAAAAPDDPDALADFAELHPYTPAREQELREALRFVRCDRREVWIRIGHALKGMGWSGAHAERAFDVWHEWSKQGDNYKSEDDCRKHWQGMHPSGEVRVATIFAAATKNGWKRSRPTTSAHAGGLDADTDGRTLLFRTTDTVENRAVRWLWPGYIAQGYLNLVVGETGAAKSTMLMDIAARVTRGDPFPGEATDARNLDDVLERKPGRVLLLGTEDGVAELIGPRLKAAGADESLTIEIYGVSQHGTRDLFSMQDDLVSMRGLISQYADSEAPVRMLVIDPITAYLSGQKVRKVDLADNGQLRAILTPWLELAQETGIAIVCITHMAKDTTRQVLHRVLGAGVFTHTARSVLVVTKLDAAAEGEYAKAVMQVKGNLPETVKPGAYRFRTEVVVTGSDKETGHPIAASRVRWEEVDPALTVASLAGGSRGPASDFGPELRGWLRSRFAREHDEQPVESVRREATEAIGFSDSWWDKHSGMYLDKRNVRGTWMCRLRTY